MLQPWVFQKEPRWREPRLSLCSRVSIPMPIRRETLSATFKEQVGLSCVLHLGEGMRRLGTTFLNRSRWPGHCCSKQKPVSGLAAISPLSPTPLRVLQDQTFLTSPTAVALFIKKSFVYPQTRLGVSACSQVGAVGW